MRTATTAAILIAACLPLAGCGGSSAAKTAASASDTPGTGQAAGGNEQATVPGGPMKVAVAAAKLPYQPASGKPALHDVQIRKTGTCSIPSDNSGNEAQVLDTAPAGSGTVNVTMEFTNPCSTAVIYTYTVAALVGGPHGTPVGGGNAGTTQMIDPGQSVKVVLPVDTGSSLSADQQAKLWLGCTQIGKDTQED